MKRILIILILLLADGSAWGANVDCYVSPTGSNTSPYETWAKAANLPSTVITYLIAAGHDPTTGHRVFIGPGEYTDTNMLLNNARLVGSLWQGTSNNTCVGDACLTAKAAPNQVIITGSTNNTFRWATPSDTGTLNNVTLKSPGAYHCVTISANNLTTNDVILDSCSNNAIFSTGGAITNNRLLVKGAKGQALYNTAGTLTCNSCVVTDSLTQTLASYAVQQTTGAGTINLNNCNIENSSYATGLIGIDAGTLNIKNSNLGPTFTGDAYTINKTGGTVNAVNNIMVQNYYSNHRLLNGSLDTDTNNITTSAPGYTHHKRFGIIIPAVDDSTNAAYVQSLIPVLKARNVNGSFAIDGVGLSETGILVKVQAIYSDGTFKLVDHTWSHSGLNATTAFTVTKSAASIDINRTTDTITVGPTAGFPTGAVTLTPFKSLQMTAIRTWLASTAGVTNGALTTMNTYAKGESLDNVSAQSINTSYTLPLLLDATLAGGFYKSEIADSKTYLESAISGLTLKTLAHVGGVDSATINTAIKNAGFVSARPGYFGTVQSSALSAINLYGIPYYDIATFITDASATDAQVISRTKAFCEWVAASGRIVALLTHNSTECTTHQMELILDTIATYSDITVTDIDTAVNTIKTSGLWTAAADCTDGGATGTCTYSHTFTDQSNYTLQLTSSGIGTGSNTPWTGTASVKDFAGNAITDAAGVVIPRWVRGLRRTNVDIGAYQTQSSGGPTGGSSFQKFNMWFRF